MTADLVNLKDDSDAEFDVTDPDSGKPVSYSDLASYVRDESDKAANKHFRFRCRKCGSTRCEVDNGIRMGSSWTGLYGSMDLTCQDCDATCILLDS